MLCERNDGFGFIEIERNGFIIFLDVEEGEGSLICFFGVYNVYTFTFFCNLKLYCAQNHFTGYVCVCFLFFLMNSPPSFGIFLPLPFLFSSRCS